MRSRRRWSARARYGLAAGLIATCALAASAPAWAADEDPVVLFREGMAAYRSGRCEEATAKLESALALDPDLHSARLPLAECYYAIGLIPGAINHLKVYITEFEPGVERERAQSQLNKYQSDLAAMAGLIESVDVSEVDLDADDPDGYEYGRYEDQEGHADAQEGGARSIRALEGASKDAGGAPRRPLLFVDAQLGASHFVTSFAPTLGDLDLGVRLLPTRFLAVGLSGRIGLGGAEAIDGLLTLPQVHLVVGPVIAPAAAQLLLGADAFLIGSRVEERDVVDPGIAFTAELRGPLGDTPLYLGGALSVGYGVGPYVSGRMVIGICLARGGER